MAPSSTPLVAPSGSTEGTVGVPMEVSDPYWTSPYDLEVTVLGVKRLPAVSGAHPALYGVHLKIENSSADGDWGDYTDTVWLECMLVNDAQESIEADEAEDANGNDLPGQMFNVDIPLDEVRTGWVYFDVPLSQGVTTFQFAPNDDDTAAEWQLP